jgi:hypothetical protein
MVATPFTNGPLDWGALLLRNSFTNSAGGCIFFSVLSDRVSLAAPEQNQGRNHQKVVLRLLISLKILPTDTNFIARRICA